MTRNICFKTTVWSLAIIVLGLVATVAIISMIYVVDQNALQRYCFDETDMFGTIYVDTSTSKIGWNIQYTANFTGTPASIRIEGPIPYGLSDGTLFVPLCGTPSTLVCDSSVYGKLKDEISETYDGHALAPYIQAIREEPWRYTGVISSSTSTVRFKLGNVCGTPS